MQPAPATATLEDRLAAAIAALDLGELLELDAMLEAIDDDTVEALAAVSVFLSVFAR